MLKRHEDIARVAAAKGWDTQAVNRLIADIENDGRATAGERASVRELLESDGFVGGVHAERSSGESRARKSEGADNFIGHSRHKLQRYAEFTERVERGGGAGPRLIGAGFDMDEARYQRNVEILAGERPAHLKMPDGRTVQVTFKDRFVPSATHQLNEVLEFFAQFYGKLGLKAELQAVPWKDETYYNMVVTIPGESDESVLFCDHYDVADKEEIVGRNKHQLHHHHHLSYAQIASTDGTIKVGDPVPGADDNASASAALMELGALLKKKLDAGVKLGRTVKLVHLVGEEMPADCLGGRHFVKTAKENNDKIAGVVVLDMIGVDRTGRRKFQINPGRHPDSIELAAKAKDAVREHGLDLKPLYRPFGSKRSFLHQTDAIHFSKAGYPTILMNEHLNDRHDLYRVGYHDEFDTTAIMNFDYASDITRAAMEVVYRTALPKEPEAPPAKKAHRRAMI